MDDEPLLYGLAGRIDPFCESAKEIDEILSFSDSFTVIRLMQRYESSSESNKTAFVAALIGRLMIAEARKK